MTAQSHRYRETRDSGVAWIGEIPAGWEIHPLRALTRPRHERNRPDLPLLTVARKRGVFVRAIGDRSENHNFIPDDLTNYKVARAGDLVINKMKAWQGSMGIAPCDGIVSPAYFVFDLSLDDPLYGAALLRSRTYITQFARISDGVRVGQWDLNMNELRRLPVLVPPASEQTAIARFLTIATKRLLHAIATRRRTVLLFREQQHAIIHQAVTRGLDPSVPLKDSGVPWLGDIPAHWEQRPLWSMYRERKERNPGGFRLLSVFLDRGVIPYEEGGGQVHAPSLDLSGYQVVREGDLVLNNQQAWRGSVGVSQYDGIISPAYIVLKPTNGLTPEFASYLFRSRPMVDQFVVASKGVGDIQRQIFKPFLRRVQIVVPPKAEQDSIAAYLSEATASATNAITHLNREIDLLQEYRTRLTFDVVTGKLDVREAAKALPDPEDTAVTEVDEWTELHLEEDAEPASS